MANRSFRISLQKRLASEQVSDFRDDRAQHLRDRASQIARWVHDHEMELRAAEPELPSDIINRLADNWRPLAAIADVAGGDCYPRKPAKDVTRMTGRTFIMLADLEIFGIVVVPLGGTCQYRF